MTRRSAKLFEPVPPDTMSHDIQTVDTAACKNPAISSVKAPNFTSKSSMPSLSLNLRMTPVIRLPYYGTIALKRDPSARRARQRSWIHQPATHRGRDLAR
jgi:hypothetical protein